MRRKILVFLMIISFIFPFVKVQAVQLEPSYWLDIKELSGNKIQVDFQVNNFQGVYGSQIYLQYNSKALTTNSDNVVGGDVILENDGKSVLISNEVTEDCVEYIITRVGKDVNYSTNGTLFSVTFTKIADKPFELSLKENSIICDKDGVELPISNHVPVKDVALNENNLTLNVGEKTTLIATVTPEEAVNKAVKWESSNEEVVTVDENGQISAIRSGEAVITVTTLEGNYQDTCNVKVKEPVTIIPVKGIAIDNTSAEIGIGQRINILATISPENATNKNISWTSSDENVATVDGSGNIIGLAAGNTAITATTEDGGYSAQCEIVVKETIEIISVTGVELNKTLAKINVGEELNLVPQITPENATNKNVIWTSSNEKAAIVDAEGKVVGLASGETIIKVITEDGEFTAECKVVVSEVVETIPVTGVKLNKSSAKIKIQEELNLSAKITPENATNKNVKWTSSNEKVATVDAKGKVVGLAAGKAIITVTTEEGQFVDTCEITVSGKLPQTGNGLGSGVVAATGLIVAAAGVVIFKKKQRSY